MRIVRASEADWQLVRALRLRALQADPSAFASSLERELAFGEREWRERIRTAGWFLALADGTPVGTAAGLPLSAAESGPTGELPPDYRIISMWVAPELRGRRVGEALLDAVLAEARTAGARKLQLWVTTGNSGALALYTRRGFVPTGRTEPLLSDPQLTVLEYVLSPGMSR